MPLEPLREPELNPPYNLARGYATVTAPPPFSFQNVVLRFFPLRADFATLGRFCDSYLNIAPEFACFRPSMPFVLLCIVDYGKMSLEQGNLGWTSQNEVFFAVPLEWYRFEDGEYVFHDLAQVTPFIFVDNESSQVGGREVFGWPKVQGWFSAEVNTWARNPRNRRHLLCMETRIFERLYAGGRPEACELLRIEEEPPPSFTQFPPRADNALNPLVSLPRALATWSSLLAEGFDLVTAPAMRGYTAIDRQALPNLVASALGSLDGFTRSFQNNNVNLKQFRDAEQPLDVCYQALTNARITVTKFIRGGMLGDLALVRGDASGGFRVRLVRYDSQPVIETLGLHVSEESSDGGERVAVLEPVLPFWTELDLRYEAGENICWRTKELDWRNRSFASVPGHDGSTSAPGHPAGSHRYNTTGSAGFQVATGPFRFPGATLRILPLLADRDRLQALCDQYLNFAGSDRANDVNRFEVWGRYVYLVATSFESMSAETNNMGIWADKRVEFAVPIRWYEKGRSGELLASTGFFSPFMYSDSGIETTTGREVTGWPTVEATIQSPPNPWLGNQGPFADVTPLLELSTDVFPALYVGQQSAWRTLLEVVDGNLLGWQARTDWNHVAEGWGAEIKRDLQSMAERAQAPEFEKLRALSLEVLANRAPLNQISLKQFRDAEDPTRACYQALVRCRTVIERIHDLREQEARVHVKIHRYPTQPIVDALGLVVQSSEQQDGVVVQCLQPSRPFYAKVDLRAELGQHLCWRAGTERWRRPTEGPSEPPYFLDGGATGVSPDLVDLADSRPQRLRDSLQRWQAQVGDELRLGREQAAAAVQADLEPQMVIHALLSHEWEHWGNPRWWQAREHRIRQLPDFVVRRDSVGTAADELFPQRVDGVGEDADYWAPEPRARRGE